MWPSTKLTNRTPAPCLGGGMTPSTSNYSSGRPADRLEILRKDSSTLKVGLQRRLDYAKSLRLGCRFPPVTQYQSNPRDSRLRAVINKKTPSQQVHFPPLDCSARLNHISDKVRSPTVASDYKNNSQFKTTVESVIGVNRSSKEYNSCKQTVQKSLEKLAKTRFKGKKYIRRGKQSQNNLEFKSSEVDYLDDKPGEEEYDYKTLSNKKSLNKVEKADPREESKTASDGLHQVIEFWRLYAAKYPAVYSVKHQHASCGSRVNNEEFNRPRRCKSSSSLPASSVSLVNAYLNQTEKAEIFGKHRLSVVEVGNEKLSLLACHKLRSYSVIPQDAKHTDIIGNFITRQTILANQKGGGEKELRQRRRSADDIQTMKDQEVDLKELAAPEYRDNTVIQIKMEVAQRRHRRRLRRQLEKQAKEAAAAVAKSRRGRSASADDRSSMDGEKDTATSSCAATLAFGGFLMKRGRSATVARSRGYLRRWFNRSHVGSGGGSEHACLLKEDGDAGISALPAMFRDLSTCRYIRWNSLQQEVVDHILSTTSALSAEDNF